MTAYPSEMEIWKAIPGYEGLYEVSNQGRVRTAEGKTTSSARFAKRVWKQRIMKQKWHERNGQKRQKDARVCLWKDGNEKTYLVARLVAMAFLPMPFDKLTVNHIDGDTTNNNVSNLEWSTIAENNRHGFRTGLFKATQKSVVLTRSDGEEVLFPSMSEADRFMGRRTGYTSLRISRSNYCYDTNGNRYIARLSKGGDPSS